MANIQAGETPGFVRLRGFGNAPTPSATVSNPGNTVGFAASTIIAPMRTTVDAGIQDVILAAVLKGQIYVQTNCAPLVLGNKGSVVILAEVELLYCQ